MGARVTVATELRWALALLVLFLVGRFAWRWQKPFVSRDSVDVTSRSFKRKLHEIERSSVR